MKWVPIAAAAVLLGSGYSVIPTYYNKLMNPHVIRRGTAKNQVALTFDDGPDPRYTPRLLDLLKEQKVKATFFVVARKAQQHPELVNRMIAEGHEVALHSYEHGNGMLKGYEYTKNDFQKSMAIMRQNHWKIRYFRPPWGHTNLFTLSFAKKYGLTPVIWSVMAQDWKEDTTVLEIAQKLIHRVKAGSVICLHDSGGAPGAPERTLLALEKVIPYWKKQGYEFVGLERMQ
ncbi:MAG: polysaccharide deacetylase family protein [Massiliimalia sp.]|jgi:peptidoglycan/xylan/chitin deacetylase (PgdA/CDA1 family)